MKAKQLQYLTLLISYQRYTHHDQSVLVSSTSRLEYIISSNMLRLRAILDLESLIPTNPQNAL